MAEICVSCDDNAYLTHTGLCGDKTCLCPNGNPVKGAQCTTNRGKICDSCDPGYLMYPRSKQCVPQMCHCEGGTPTANCTEDSPCAVCQDGNHFHHGKCRLNTCTCSHGIAATGENCLADGLEVCRTCKSGYHSVQGTRLVPRGNGQVGDVTRTTVSCASNVCTCPNGTPASPLS